MKSDNKIKLEQDIQKLGFKKKCFDDGSGCWFTKELKTKDVKIEFVVDLGYKKPISLTIYSKHTIDKKDSIDLILPVKLSEINISEVKKALENTSSLLKSFDSILQ